MLKMSLIYW